MINWGDLDLFLSIVVGNREGFLALGYGHQPYRNDHGKYDHREFRQEVIGWPKGKIAPSVHADTYVCPAIRLTKDRRQYNAAPPMILWTDLDGQPADPALLAYLEPFAVDSGTPGHRHAYVLLDRPADLGLWNRLQVALRDRLGGDHKIADNDLLRLPGTVNLKPTLDGKDPAPVRVLRPSEHRWLPEELAEIFGIDLTANATNSAASKPPVPAEPIDQVPIPDWLWDEFAKPADDRSARFQSVINACARAGLTEGQTLTMINEHWPPGVEKYGGRLPEMVALSWTKRRGKAADPDSNGRTRGHQGGAGPCDEDDHDGGKGTPGGTASNDDDQQEAERERQVLHELNRLRIRTEARELFEAERSGGAEPFDAGTLRHILTRPKPPSHRITGLMPWDADLLIVAQRKVGKTTLILNHVDSLLTGHPFLGHYQTVPLAGNAAILNYEVAGDQLAAWAQEAGIDPDRLLLINLRGRRNPLRHPADRAGLAELLRQHNTEALYIDPFSRAYTGTSHNDPGEVGAWLTDLDLFARAEAGARDLILTHHTGWNGERSRGSTALEDWADSIVTMVKDPDTGQRYFHAEGRDVDIDEQELGLTGRRLRVTGAGSRKAAREQAKWHDQERAVLDALGDQTEPINTTDLHAAVKGCGVGFQRGDVSRTCNRLLDKRLIDMTPGPNNQKLWSRVTLN